MVHMILTISLCHGPYDMNHIGMNSGMKDYLHRPAEYCRFIRSRFLNIDAILDAELRLLEHVTGNNHNVLRLQ